MDLVQQAVNATKTGDGSDKGSGAHALAIRAACNAGFNAPSGAPMPQEFEGTPLLESWYAIGLKAQVQVM